MSYSDRKSIYDWAYLCHLWKREGCCEVTDLCCMKWESRKWIFREPCSNEHVCHFLRQPLDCFRNSGKKGRRSRTQTFQAKIQRIFHRQNKWCNFEIRYCMQLDIPLFFLFFLHISLDESLYFRIWLIDWIQRMLNWITSDTSTRRGFIKLCPRSKRWLLTSAQWIRKM